MKEKSDKLYFIFWKSGGVFFLFLEKTVPGDGRVGATKKKQEMYQSPRNCRSFQHLPAVFCFTSLLIEVQTLCLSRAEAIPTTGRLTVFAAVNPKSVSTVKPR